MSIVGFDVFGLNNTLSLKSETKVFNAASKPHPGVWDDSNNQFTYDSSKTFTDVKTPLKASNYTYTNGSERGSIRKPSSGSWTGKSNACYVTANNYGGPGVTPGWEIHIWLLANIVPTNDCDIVIPYPHNVSLTSVPYMAVADAIYNGNITDSSIAYVSPQTVICGNIGWRGQVIKDSYGNCMCDSNTIKLSAGDIAAKKGGGSFTIPNGETWCVKETTCNNTQYKEINELGYKYECRDIRGCMDEGNTLYNPNAAKHSSSSCGADCKLGYAKTHLGAGTGSCSKLLESYISPKNGADRYSQLALTESGYTNAKKRYTVIRRESIHDTANPTGVKGGSHSYTTLDAAMTAFEDLKEQYLVKGCTDSTSEYYNQDANVDDGCGKGCTDSNANNYNPDAIEEDGSCKYDILGCTDSTAKNYNPNANTDDGSCIGGAVNGDDMVGMGELPNWALPVAGIGLLAIILISMK